MPEPTRHWLLIGAPVSRIICGFEIVTFYQSSGQGIDDFGEVYDLTTNRDQVTCPQCRDRIPPQL